MVILRTTSSPPASVSEPPTVCPSTTGRFSPTALRRIPTGQRSRNSSVGGLEMATLQANLDAAIGGRGRIVLVGGKAGRGTTALLSVSPISPTRPVMSWSSHRATALRSPGLATPPTIQVTYPGFWKDVVIEAH